MRKEFLNRRRELCALTAMDRVEGAQLVAVYGRRRVGKTSLLLRWLEGKRERRAVYWVAHRSTPSLLLAGFSQALGPLVNASDPGFSFSSWQAALEGVARLAAGKRLVVVIDELPYLLESVPAFATLLQAAWDGALQHSRVRLILSGSHYHMMQSTLASPKGALYGRTTSDLLVDELSLDSVALFLPRYSPEQLLEVYSVVGGVPKYLELWNDRRPVLWNIRELLLSPASIFRDEPLFLVHDEIADPRTYLAVLDAIGTGARRPVEIARASGVNLAHIGKYLHTLEALRFVRRLVSADAAGSRISRTSQYEIRDPYLRFHFTFVQPNMHLLEQQRADRLMEAIALGFDAYVGRTGYEEICRAHVAGLVDRHELSFEALEVGRMWDRRVELDLVALGTRTRSALVGECRWRRTRMGTGDLDDLELRASRMEKLKGHELRFALFSRSGFTAALRERARREDVMLVEGVPGVP